MIGSIAGIANLATPAVQPGKTADAAKQFEALLVAQILKAARESGGSWLGTGEEDQAGQIGVEVAEQEFARALAAGGGLGLARLIAQGLEQPSGGAAIQPEPSNRPKAAEPTPGESGG